MTFPEVREVLCDRCHEKEAVVSIVEIIGGKEQTLNLCRECAAKTAGSGITIMQLPGSSFMSELLASVLGLSEDDQKEDSDSSENLKKNNVICPSCNMTYDEFLKYGTFGCPECYRTFNFLLDGYLKKIQGNNVHTGKHPLYSQETTVIPDIAADDSISDDEEAAAQESGQIGITVDRDSSVDELKAALRRAVAREEYEEAARIRDMIRSCKGDSSNV